MIKKDSKLLTFLTFAPVPYIVLYLFFVFSGFFYKHNGLPAFRYVTYAIYGILAIYLLVFYIRDILENNDLDDIEKQVWIILTVLFGFLFMNIVYWFKYIRRENRTNK